jgi:hypothetical protein
VLSRVLCGGYFIRTGANPCWRAGLNLRIGDGNYWQPSKVRQPRFQILETITILARIVRQKPPITNVRDHVELAITWNCNSSVEAHLRTLLNIFRRHRDDLPVGRCPIRAQRNHWKEHWLSQQVAYTIQPRANVEKDVKLSNVIGSEAARAAAARRPRFNPFRVSSTTVGGPPKLHPSSHVNRSLTQPIPALP